MIAGIALSVGLGLLAIGPGVLFGAAGGYMSGYMFGGIMTFLPDILLVGGAVLISFCLALLLLWLGVFVAVGGTYLVVRATGGIYRKILGRGGSGRG